MKRTFIYILCVVIVIMFTMTILSFAFPFSEINIKNYINDCRTFELINVEDDNKYVTREEFLEAMLKSVGMTKNVFDSYYHRDYSTAPIDDFNVENGPYSFGADMDTDEQYKYLTLCVISAVLRCMQAYKYEDTKNNEEYIEYRGKSYVKFNEAVVMFQACLCDTDGEYDAIIKNTSEFRKLYLRSHFNSFIHFYDSCYWSFGNFKLKRHDMYILLGRFLQQKRYKYLIEPKPKLDINGEPCIVDNKVLFEGASTEIDEERSITYRQYLVDMYDVGNG